MDRLLGSCRPTIRRKKWYWPLVINATNISVVTAWRPRCKVNASAPSHLEFCREVTFYLQKSSTQPHRQVGGGAAPNLSADLRYNDVDHYKKPAPQGRFTVSHKNTRYRCLKCNVRWHCDKGSVRFELYHR